MMPLRLEEEALVDGGKVIPPPPARSHVLIWVASEGQGRVGNAAGTTGGGGRPGGGREEEGKGKWPLTWRPFGAGQLRSSAEKSGKDPVFQSFHLPRPPSSSLPPPPTFSWGVVPQHLLHGQAVGGPSSVGRAMLTLDELLLAQPYLGHRHDVAVYDIRESLGRKENHNPSLH